MANSSTTIVFVPGAWHNPVCFSIVAYKLREAGYKTKYVHLPSVGPAEYLKSFDPDVQAIKNSIAEEADAGQKVVVVVHSYGGVPASVAVEGLDVATRQAGGLPGGVSHLFYCCASMIPEGKSLIEAFGQDLPWATPSPDRMSVEPVDPEKIFYSDLPKDVAEAAVAHLKTHSYQTFHSRVKYAGWMYIPTTFMYCLQDLAMPLFVQKMMVEEWAKGIDIRTETVDASHSPFLSKPAEMTAAIRRAAGETV